MHVKTLTISPLPFASKHIRFFVPFLLQRADGDCPVKENILRRGEIK